jgi:predicted nucleotidyltransferase
VYQAKDFIETAQGLLFAVVMAGVEAGKVRCFLRYIQIDQHWQKVNTDIANQYLQTNFPQYLFYSNQLDAELHGVELSQIVSHYSPQKSLQSLLQQVPSDQVIADLQQLCGLFAKQAIDLQQIGITGSCLLGLQNHNSDIDLVCYDRTEFHRLRNVVQSLIASNDCQDLADADWLEAYQRRNCDLSLDDYIWHEQRKYNKALINQRKFDLSLLVPSQSVNQQFQKLGMIELQAKVIDDQFSFDYPAEFLIDDPEIKRVVCFTATYNGQAFNAEQVAIAGQLEQDQFGVKRVVVGSNREALGEYIKVIHG